MDVNDQLTPFVNDVKTTAGTVLMTLGYYRDNEWYQLYTRTDFKQAHTEADHRRIATDVILDGLTKQTKEHIWQAGELDYFISRFTEAVVIQVSVCETEGVVIGLDRVPLEDLTQIIDRCLLLREEQITENTAG